MYTKESAGNTGKPQDVVRDDQPDAREGQAGPPGERTPGSAREERGNPRPYRDQVGP